MMPSEEPEVWIPDATPIILLGKIGMISLLTSHGKEHLMLVQAVADEVLAAPPGDLGRLALREINQLGPAHFPLTANLPQVETFGLDPGESAVLTAALNETAQGHRVLVVMDETKGRAAAKALGIETLGTVGLLIRAQRTRRIQSLVPFLHRLRAAGAWLSEEFCEKVALSVGETWP